MTGFQKFWTNYKRLLWASMINGRQNTLAGLIAILMYLFVTGAIDLLLRGRGAEAFYDFLIALVGLNLAVFVVQPVIYCIYSVIRTGRPYPCSDQ